MIYLGTHMQGLVPFLVSNRIYKIVNNMKKKQYILSYK